MAYRQVTVTPSTPVRVQELTDLRVYKKAVLTVDGADIRLIPGEGTDPVSSTFGQSVYGGAGTAIEGGGNIRMATMISAIAGQDATVGIDLQV